jgi:energy-coupling factor transport system ATP-binding protein
MDDCKTVHTFDGIKLPDKIGENIIATQNLLVNNIKYPDMEFKRGSISAILGASGSGKTTLFKTLIGQNKYKGEINFLGKSLSKQSKSRIFSKCGIVFQNPSNQFLAMTVYDEILFSVKHWNKVKDKEWQAQKTEELLSLFDLNKYKKYAPYLLSQGQQRRLAVLSMIAGEQEIILMDEPTYGQDYENIRAIMNLILDKALNGLTVIFNTHNEKVAEHFSHKIIRIGV